LRSWHSLSNEIFKRYQLLGTAALDIQMALTRTTNWLYGEHIVRHDPVHRNRYAAIGGLETQAAHDKGISR